MHLPAFLAEEPGESAPVAYYSVDLVEIAGGRVSVRSGRQRARRPHSAGIRNPASGVSRLNRSHSIVRLHGQLAGAALSSFRYHSLNELVCDSIGP